MQLNTNYHLATDSNSRSFPSSPIRKKIDDVMSVSIAFTSISELKLEKENSSIEPRYTKTIYAIFFEEIEKFLSLNEEKISPEFLLQVKSQYFNDPLPQCNTLHEFAKVLENYSRALFKRSLENLGEGVYRRCFTPTDHDRTLTYWYPFLKAEVFTCHEYVMYLLNIKSNPDQQTPLAVTCIPTINPRPGDVVVYGDRVGSAFVPKHFGLLVEPDLVYSKWGKSPEIVKHKLNNVLSVYGNTIKFLSRLGKFDCELRLQEMIKHAANHQYVVCTFTGFKNFFLDQFKNLYHLNYEDVLEGSIHNKPTMRAFSKLVLAELEKRAALANNREDFLSGLDSKVKQFADDQPTIIPK